MTTLIRGVVSGPCDCCKTADASYRIDQTGVSYCTWCYSSCGALRGIPAEVSAMHNPGPEEVVSDEDFEEYRQKLVARKDTPMTVKDLLVALFNQQPEALVVWQDDDGVLHGLAQVLADGGAVVKLRWG